MRIAQPPPRARQGGIDVRVRVRRYVDLVARIDDVAAFRRQVLQPGNVVLRRLLDRSAVAVQEDDERTGLPLRGVEPDLPRPAAERTLLLHRLRLRRTP